MFLDFFYFQIIFDQIEQYHPHQPSSLALRPTKSAPNNAIELIAVEESTSKDGFPEIGKLRPFLVLITVPFNKRWVNYKWKYQLKKISSNINLQLLWKSFKSIEATFFLSG